jgi:hypothetical protein
MSNAFITGARNSAASNIETIKYPTDETEPWWDTFDVVEELQDLKFEIAFTGTQDDLIEHTEEMWRRVAKRDRTQPRRF